MVTGGGGGVGISGFAPSSTLVHGEVGSEAGVEVEGGGTVEVMVNDCDGSRDCEQFVVVLYEKVRREFKLKLILWRDDFRALRAEKKSLKALALEFVAGSTGIGEIVGDEREVSRMPPPRPRPE